MRPAGIVLVTSLLLTPSTAAQDTDRAGATAAFEAFYAGMKKGDAASVMRSVAPDAIFLESGRQETRAEYESGHLPADMEFERAVAGKRGPLTVNVIGDVAWISAMTEYEGTFEGKPVNFVGAQLMVLTRTSGRWLIRSVHWSSRRR
jgi:ketosteroid isomerase-like protein